MHEAFRQLQYKSARLQAIYTYCDWCISQSGVRSPLPDFQESGIELISGKPHAVVRNIQGEILAIYRIRTDGSLKREVTDT